jgi:hypothetical protein
LTLPYERKSAVLRTEQFLKDLLDPKKTPCVPKTVREEARRCLKHYPSDLYMEEAANQAPAVFGDWKNG